MAIDRYEGAEWNGHVESEDLAEWSYDPDEGEISVSTTHEFRLNNTSGDSQTWEVEFSHHMFKRIPGTNNEWNLIRRRTHVENVKVGNGNTKTHANLDNPADKVRTTTAPAQSGDIFLVKFYTQAKPIGDIKNTSTIRTHVVVQGNKEDLTDDYVVS